MKELKKCKICKADLDNFVKIGRGECDWCKGYVRGFYDALLVEKEDDKK